MKKRITFILLCLLGLSVLFGCNNKTKTNEVVSDAAKETFTINSEDESATVKIDTSKDGDHLRIDTITIINNGVTLNTLDNIVGYYDTTAIHSETSRAIITYYGSKWINFLILDTTTGSLLFYEPFNFSDVMSAYQNNNNIMNFELNESHI